MKLDELFEKYMEKNRYEIDKKRGCVFIYDCDTTMALPLKGAGKAHKHPDDKYSEEIGKALAFYRMKGVK